MLNGGDTDGVADYLNGGAGADDYHREMFFDIWTWSNRNREVAVGFDPAEGDAWV